MLEHDSFGNKRLLALGQPTRDLPADRLTPRGPLGRLVRRVVRSVEALTVDRGLDTDEPRIELEHFHSDRVWYQPSSWRTLRRALRKDEVKPTDVFVDFGCGKGRVLICAARYRFARVIGVEISPRLSEIARDNLARASRKRACRDVQVVTCDAVDFEIPDDMTHAYFYYPFMGGTFQTVLNRIVESVDRRPRRVTLIYLEPRRERDVLATGRFKLVREISGRMRDRISPRIHVYSSESGYDDAPSPERYVIRKRKSLWHGEERGKNSATA
jgi:SAM-dependent methyltransferase